MYSSGSKLFLCRKGSIEYLFKCLFSLNTDRDERARGVFKSSLRVPWSEFTRPRDTYNRNSRQDKGSAQTIPRISRIPSPMFLYCACGIRASLENPVFGIHTTIHRYLTRGSNALLLLQLEKILHCCRTLIKIISVRFSLENNASREKARVMYLSNRF